MNRIKNLLYAATLVIALLVTRNANAYSCGQDVMHTYSIQSTWRYKWQTSTITLNGYMYVYVTNGYVRAFIDIPDEITDPAQRAAWNWTAYGQENGNSVRLSAPSYTGSPWWFELTIVRDTKARIFSMSGAEYAGVEHIPQNLTFSATNLAFTSATTTGVRIDCPATIPPDPSGTWNYIWQTNGTTYHGVLSVQAALPYVWGTLGVPNEITDPVQRNSWNWQFYATYYVFNGHTYLEALAWPYNPGTGQWWELKDDVQISQLDSYGPLQDEYALESHAPLGLTFYAYR